MFFRQRIQKILNAVKHTLFKLYLKLFLNVFSGKEIHRSCSDFYKKTFLYEAIKILACQRSADMEFTAQNMSRKFLDIS